MRIDGGVIRVRDTRIFHQYTTTTSANSTVNSATATATTDSNTDTNTNQCQSSDYIYMDVTWHESTISLIESYIGDGRKIMESTLRTDPSSVMRVIPIVNDKEHIVKHHRLKIN